MADVAVSAAMELLLTVVKEQIQNEVHLVRGFDKELLDLSDKLKNVRNVLDDADTKQFKDKTVRDWLRRQEQTSYEMEDVLEEWNYAILQHKIESEFESQSAAPLKQKVCPFVPSSCFSFKKLGARRDIAKKIQNLKSRLDKILNEKDVHNFVISQPKSDPSTLTSWRVQSDSTIDLAEVRGRKDDRDILVSKLTSNDGSHEGYRILSIVGAGGLGKTTLAQLVYNDTLVQEFFDLRIWLCVSDPFDVAVIAKGIIESVTKESSLGTNQLDVILEVLKDCISGKKILLVLDDVWNEREENWKPLRNVLKCVGANSKILVTTRKLKVAEIMDTNEEDVHCPKLLSDEECWLLMRSAALFGKNERENHSFEEIGKEIAKKCKGLPLATMTLRSVLHSKKTIEGWKNVLKSDMWELEQAEVELFPHLLLSYNELSPVLKHCFSYCALYSKDKEIRADELIRLWMAMGYLGSDIGSAGNEVELKGQEYVEDLAMRSLFQDFQMDYNNQRIVSFKLHDIVHDFAHFLRKNDPMTNSSCQVCDHLSVSQVQEYRSLILGEETPLNICNCLTSLMVLRFRCVENGSFQGMEKLIHLKWLDISHTKLSDEDFKSICKLYFLQTLLLVGCSLKVIPREIGNLVQLRHLNLCENEELIELPESIGSLLQLQTLHNRFNALSIFWGINTEYWLVVICGYTKLGLFKKLNRFTGILELVINVSSDSSYMEELVEDARKAELHNKMHLQTLNLRFVHVSYDEDELPSSSSLWMELIEALEPHHNLEQLIISRYKGQTLPDWISSPLNLVTSIRLSYCSSVLTLPPLGQLPFLEELHLLILMKLKAVGRKWLGSCTTQSDNIPSSSSSSSVIAFPKLKRLEFRLCDEWEEWEDITEEEEESAAFQLMPSLNELCIKDCCALKKLPHRLLRKLQSLQSVDLSFSKELKNYYQDKDGVPRRYISQIHPQLQFIPSSLM